MMAAEATTRYRELCRLCANKTNLLLSVHIFENEGVVRQIHKKIETCLPIQVHEGDELPKTVCDSCVYKIELFHDFRERCVRAESLLVNVFKSVHKLENEQLLLPLGKQQLDAPEFIMVHQPLLGSSIPGVADIDLAHLTGRDNMIVEHEIILTQPNDLDQTTLTSISLEEQELSNHSLSTPESMLAHVTDSVRYPEDHIQLTEQDRQLLNEQYRLEESLDVNLNENETVSVRASETFKQSSNETLEEKIDIKLGELRENERKSPSSTLDANAIVFCGTSSSENTNDDNSLLLENPLSEVEINRCSDDSFLFQNQNGIVWSYCNLCGKSFSEKTDFQLHYDDHFNKCTMCSALFSNREALNEHRKEMHMSKKSEPTEEVEVERNESTIKEDVSSDENVGNDEEASGTEETTPDSPSKKKKWSPKVCKECGKSYKTNYKLSEHMRKHTGEKPYKCGSCEKAFRSKIGLAQHEAKHTGQYELFCTTCGKGFQCKSYLMVHQRVHSDIKPYPCTTCGRNFKTKQSLLDHTNRHLGVKPYMCEVCGRGFITKGLCKAHQKVHTGLDNRKYSCKICNKMFVSKSYLQTHLKIHTGEKPFICEVCGKGFLTRVDLRIHLTMHTGEKSYVCEICGKAFARRDALRCHRRSHTGERPYSCDHCGQTFTQFSPMVIHKRLHTGERPYPCEVCGKAFVSRSTMMSHFKKH